WNRRDSPCPPLAKGGRCFCPVVSEDGNGRFQGGRPEITPVGHVIIAAVGGEDVGGVEKGGGRRRQRHPQRLPREPEVPVHPAAGNGRQCHPVGGHDSWRPSIATSSTPAASTSSGLSGEPS